MEILSARSTEIDVVSCVVMHASLGKHGIVLDLGFAKRRAVIRNNHQLCFSLPQTLQSSGQAQRDFPTFHHERQTRVYALDGLLLLLRSDHLSKIFLRAESWA
uniref:Uncharacterized protein n=1 Tax=Ditylum brightwellii TaxID=49249 RepID=A0A7S4VQ07_9STRA